MRKGVSNLSSLFAFNEVLNLGINAWSLHTYGSEHQIPHSRGGTPARFTERPPQSCMTTDLIDHHSKNNKEATCSRRRRFYHTCLRNKVSHWDFLSDLISIYPPSLEALRFVLVSLFWPVTRVCAFSFPTPSFFPSDPCHSVRRLQR